MRSPETIAAQIYYGKGLSSKELYDQLYETCNFPTDPDVTPNSPNYDFEISMECELLLRKQSEQVGPHNVCECSSTYSHLWTALACCRARHRRCFLLTCLRVF